MQPFGTSQAIVIGYLNYDQKNYSDDSRGESLNLADGKKTRIEAFLYDEKGEIYELQITGIGGVWLSRKFTEETVDGKTESSAQNFPTDRTYTKLRIRSEIPLKCDRIEWVGTNSK